MRSPTPSRRPGDVRSTKDRTSDKWHDAMDKVLLRIIGAVGAILLVTLGVLMLVGLLSH